MQSTPLKKLKFWYTQWESIGYYRSNAMLWGRTTDDPWRSWGIFNETPAVDMEGSVKYARSLGFEVDMVYPHERYHTQKAYADNFNFIKETISDIEDEEEVIFDVMQKLV